MINTNARIGPWPGMPVTLENTCLKVDTRLPSRGWALCQERFRVRKFLKGSSRRGYKNGDLASLRIAIDLDEPGRTLQFRRQVWLSEHQVIEKFQRKVPLVDAVTYSHFGQKRGRLDQMSRQWF